MKIPLPVAAILAVAFLSGSCGVLGEEEPSGDGSREKDQPVVSGTPDGASEEFTTDFTKHSVPYDEIPAAGPPKDGIPAIDEPRFVGVDEADAWLEPREPVIQLHVEDEVKAYPIFGE